MITAHPLIKELIMTTHAVQDFLTTVSQDSSLQAEMLSALEAENDREAVTALAKSKGYNFTSDELWAEVQARKAQTAEGQESAELRDADLELIAGGGLYTPGNWNDAWAKDKDNEKVYFTKW